MNNMMNGVAISVLLALSSVSQAKSAEEFDVSSFDKPKASVVYDSGKSQDLGESYISDYFDKNSSFVVNSLNTGISYSIDKILKNEISGVYENLTEDGEVMTLTFQGKKNSNLDTIKSDLTNYGIYTDKMWDDFQVVYNSAMDSYITSSHNEYAHEHFDLNHINMKYDGDDLALLFSINKDLSQDELEIMRVFVFLHEQAHSHISNKDSWSFISQVGDIEQESEFKDKLFDFMNYYEGLETQGESYADSFALMATVKYIQEKYPDQNPSEKIEQFLNNVDEYRSAPLKTLQNGEDLKHLTLPTVKSTISFIQSKQNDMIDISFDDMKNIAKHIKDRTFENGNSKEIKDENVNKIVFDLLKVSDYKSLNEESKVNVKKDYKSFLSKKNN
jgi:hypothetical protein